MNIKELCQAIIDDEELQIKSADTWYEGHSIQAMYTFYNSAIDNDSDQVRIKPNLKPVDLSILAKSGIDCEFSNTFPFTEIIISPLKKIEEDGGACSNYRAIKEWYQYCRPRMNHTHAWQGGKCPLPEGLLVKLIHRKGPDKITDDPQGWNHIDVGSDIIAFEILSLEKGYGWLWECDK